MSPARRLGRRDVLAVAFADAGFPYPARDPTRAADQARGGCERDFDRGHSIAGCMKALARGGAESSQNGAIAYNNRDIAYYRKADFARAIRYLDGAIRLDPEYASAAHHNRGPANDNKGDHDSAVRDYDEAICLNPSDYAARAVREEALRALAQARSKPQPPMPAPLSEPRVAVIIGKAPYAAQSPLRNPGNAAAVASALRVQEFQDEADRADWVVIYFSGHGVEIGGKNYAVPTDARLQTYRNTSDEANSLHRLMDIVVRAHKLRMVILDARLILASPRCSRRARQTSRRTARRGVDATDHRPQPFVYRSLPGTRILFPAMSAPAPE